LYRLSAPNSPFKAGIIVWNTIAGMRSPAHRA
jgi:hypothetical protein